MYKPAYTHLMNPAWMSTFLFLAPAQTMQKNSDVSTGKRNNNQTTERSSNRPCEVLQQELELCSQITV